MKKPDVRPAQNLALPKAGKSGDRLRKEAAFTTLAVEEFGSAQSGHGAPQSGDSAVDEARAWVAYDEL